MSHSIQRVGETHHPNKRRYAVIKDQKTHQHLNPDQIRAFSSMFGRDPNVECTADSEGITLALRPGSQYAWEDPKLSRIVHQALTKTMNSLF